MRTLFQVLLALLWGHLLIVPVSANEEDHWVISQTGRDFEYNTGTGFVTTKGVSLPGLLGISRSGGHEARTFWNEGAFGASILFDGQLIADGGDIDAVSRITGFRFNRAGGYVFLKTDKGPLAQVELVHNGHVVHRWPRFSVVRVLAFAVDEVIVSLFDEEKQSTHFVRMSGLSGPAPQIVDEQIGSVENCSVLGSKVIVTGIVLQLFCDPEQGSDVMLLSYATGALEAVSVSGDDAILTYQLGKRPGFVSVLSVGGNDNARRAFHAIFGVMMRSLGEPMSRASDAAGKQSWSQSYRTLTLASLYRQTGHRVFSELAIGAMENTLAQTNQQSGVGGENNPPCAWASRIYSVDKRSPISLLINQAMISGSLLRSCTLLGRECSPALAGRVRENAQCLVESYERDFDQTEGLYRIPYGAPFRYDGILAPWNWQMRWVGVLGQLGRMTGQTDLELRAEGVADRFMETWVFGEAGVLWRYWTPSYYLGWRKEDAISLHRPRQSADQRGQFEDLNHAGISLLGLSQLGRSLSEDDCGAVAQTLERLLLNGAVMPREMDGRGPRSPRWLPGAGWDAFAPQQMRRLYSRLLPGSVSSDQHLTYATLFDAGEAFNLSLTFSYCRQAECDVVKEWHFDSVADFLADNPLFEIAAID